MLRRFFEIMSNEPIINSSGTFYPICKFRSALDYDVEEINSFVTPDYFELFGPTSIEYRIKKSYFSMVAINEDDRIVALICLDDHPNIPALPPSEWENWFQSFYNINGITSQGTLWIHFLACHPSYTYVFASPLLRQVFLSFPLVANLIAVIPGESPRFSFLEDNFACILPSKCVISKKIQCLYLTLRHHFTRVYKVRSAVEEDNDDLVPLINEHNTKLKETYGEYYISELLTRFPDMDRHLIVAEIEERAKAVLILNGVVNYDALFKSFNMEPFGNLYNVNIESYFAKLPTEMSSDNSSELTQPVESKTFNKHYYNDSFHELTKSENEIFCLEDIEELVEEFLMNPSTEKLNKLRKLSGTNFIELGKKRVSLHEPDADFDLQDDVIESDEYLLKNLEAPSCKNNAFTLEVMAADKDHEVAVVCDLLESAFQRFPNKEYCVFSILHNQPHFPLFDYFVKVVPRVDAIYPQELYILHKNAIKADLVVHEIRKGEFKEVKELIRYIEHYHILLDTITKSLFSSNNKLYTYVLVNYSKIVGLIIVRRERDIQQYLMNYKVHTFLDFNMHKYDRFGLILFCIVSPIFQKYISFFLRETHRLSDMSILFYKLENHEISRKNRLKPLPCILKDVVPVINRQLPSFCQMRLNEIRVLNYFLKNKDDLYALYLSTPKLCSLPRIDINSRIVVVGTSTVGLSFIEELTMNFDGLRLVNFNNLTIVYGKAVDELTMFTKFSAGMFVFRGNFYANHMFSIGFHTNLNHVHGFMTAINRRHKYIIIDGDTIIPYDYLFLMCGLQYHFPYAEGIRRDKISEICPKNVFVINKYRTAELAIRTLLKYSSLTRPRTVIVYGSTLHAYCCLSTLQFLNLPNLSIYFVEPNTDEYEKPIIDAFNNPLLHATIHTIMKKSGITSHSGYSFVEWHLDYTKNYIVSAKFQSRDEMIHLNCDFMFCYAFKEVCHGTFTAVNNAGLVYDGKLVIGPDCRTNDPYIFAAGPMTKYARRYYADRFLHAYYNSHEIGKRLAKQIRAMLLPGGLEENEGDRIYKELTADATNKLVPRYESPIIESCVLPNHYNYFNMTAPGKPIPYAKYMTSNRVGMILETGELKTTDPKANRHYFRIQLNLNNVVEQITCFTKEEFDFMNYINLFGLHERFLNDLVKRYKIGEIEDFYEFFRNPYFCAIYTDSFVDLQLKLRSILDLLAEEPDKSILEDVLKRLKKNKWRRFTSEMTEKVKTKYVKSPYHTLMVNSVMKFLEQNFESLPMYAHPLVTKQLIEGIEESPLFINSRSQRFTSKHN